uniref:Kalirin RhoGEF kinase n=1 Tax=Homo sapiens TaxID=9606 RepID=A0A804HHT5_HUMAN
MNPPEGAAEEGGAADSDVDAFFRTAKWKLLLAQCSPFLTVGYSK